MGRPKIELTKEQIDHVRDAWEKSQEDDRKPGNIYAVARVLGVTWQTARRWLILAGCIDETNINDRLDRPGKKWPAWKVTIEEYENEVVVEIVEAPSWAIAFEMVAMVYSIDSWESARVDKVDDTPTPGFDRQSVKEKLAEHLTPEGNKTLILHYASLGVDRSA